MSRTDLISDAFAIIHNAARVKKQVANVPASSTIKAIAQILKNEGYIDNYKFIEDKKQGIVRFYLKYTGGKSAIIGLKRISKPGLRTYVKRDEIPLVLNGMGIALISTSQGILTGRASKEKMVGGEVIGYIW
ncbi:MAG: 30S ribosomal protein S8 [Candidatus Omnitrophota bacterium]